MHKFKFVLLFVFSIGNVQITSGQDYLATDIYQSWEGKNYECFVLETQHTVIFFEKTQLSEDQFRDIETILKIGDRVEKSYSFYKENLGFEPPGGHPGYQNKASVFFGPPSCGAACGAIGSKGIEAGIFLNKIFFSLKYNTQVNPDVIIGYEFGRNFLTFGDKFLYPGPYDDGIKNLGFAEGFADLFYIYLYDEILEGSQREYNETLLNIDWKLKAFRGYINDDSATPYNSLYKWEKYGLLDPNRGWNGLTYEPQPAYPGGALLMGIVETLGRKNLFPKFFDILRNRNSVLTVEDALSNIAYSASMALNKNLLPFFINVLKFKLNDDVIEEISNLPKIESFLIKDEPILWFLSPFEKIKLNLKSINYLEDNGEYRVYVNNELYSINKTGVNLFDYSILNGKDDVLLECQLLIDGNVVDKFFTKLIKRDKLNFIDYKENFYPFYLYNESIRFSFEGDLMRIESLDKGNYVGGLINYNFPFSRNRSYIVEGKVRHVSTPYEKGLEVQDRPVSGWTNFALQGPGRAGGTIGVGLDILQGDTVNFAHLVQEFIFSNDYIPEEKDYFTNYLNILPHGYGLKAEIKDLIFYDITDTDSDGIIDFEDDCPSTPGECNGCPDTQNPLIKVKSNYILKLDAEGKAALKWEDLDDGSSDNCSITERKLSKTDFTCVDIGSNKVTFTAKDASGNASSAEVTVTVVDEIKPTLKVKAGYTIKLDAEGKAALKWEDLDDGSSDNCSITERKLSKTDFTPTDGGDNKVTYTITDASGNASSIEITVRIDIVLSAPERANQGNSIKAFPNPVNDYLYLEFADGIKASAFHGTTLVDASGKVLGEIQLEEGAAGQLSFSTRELEAGIYFLRLSTRDTLHLIKFKVIH